MIMFKNVSYGGKKRQLKLNNCSVDLGEHSILIGNTKSELRELASVLTGRIKIDGGEVIGDLNSLPHTIDVSNPFLLRHLSVDKIVNKLSKKNSMRMDIWDKVPKYEQFDQLPNHQKLIVLVEIARLQGKEVVILLCPEDDLSFKQLPLFESYLKEIKDISLLLLTTKEYWNDRLKHYSLLYLTNGQFSIERR
ncbi:hypothetical protein F8N00_14125 [Exiguobacterium sp. A1_3_1]|uniref:ABC transporter domain-containing protein n=1 Tax=Exiguobacterium indicum TaxID=296995 RepID=A0ABU8EII3_9BACL